LIPVEIRRHVDREIDKAIAAYAKQAAKDQGALLKGIVPRRASFDLTNIAVGTHTVAVSWSVPIPGDFHVQVEVICGSAFVGLLTAGPTPTTKTPTGCTITVANRGGGPAAAAAFNVLAFPL
jgi:hypothetical protein